MSDPIQVVTFIFYTEPGFPKAFIEFKWTLKQNPEFWKSVVLYTDPECYAVLSRHEDRFQEIVVDRDMPEQVLRNKTWCCKGWWAKCGVDRFGRILQVDLDLFVRKPVDEELVSFLDHAPRFLDIPSYTSPRKAVGCGCACYDAGCDWDRFLDILYNQHHHDERAWTATLGIARKELLERKMDMDPYIVDQGWLLENPDARDEAYIVHGISQHDNGRRLLRKIGYSEKEIHFACRPHEELIYRAGNIKRWFQGKSDPACW